MGPGPAIGGPDHHHAMTARDRSEDLGLRVRCVAHIAVIHVDHHRLAHAVAHLWATGAGGVGLIVIDVVGHGGARGEHAAHERGDRQEFAHCSSPKVNAATKTPERGQWMHCKREHLAASGELDGKFQLYLGGIATTGLPYDARETNPWP